MEVHQVTINYKVNDVFRIHPLGDLHDGTQHFVEGMFKRKVNEIANDDKALWVGLGDYCEFITTHDPRWDSNCVSSWVEKDNIAVSETNHVASLLAPIKDKCIGLIEGNHETAIKFHNDVNVHKNLCEALGVPNLGYSCWLKLRFKRANSTESHIVKCVITHGAGGAVTPGAKLARLFRFMNGYDANIFMHGHTHDIITHSYPLLTLNNSDTITHTQKVGAMTGCWFSTYTQGVSASYGERKSYPATTLGSPVFEIKLTRDNPPEIAVMG